jgi:hypothetical protein
MNCDLACHLIDDYMENQLSRYDSLRLEKHLDTCQNCADELAIRPELDRAIQRALVASVQQRNLSPEASMRIVRQAQGNLRRGIWTDRGYWGLKLAFAGVAVSLVLVAVFFILSGLPVPAKLNPVTLLPVTKIPFFEQYSATLVAVDQPAWLDGPVADVSPGERSALFVGQDDFQIEPHRIEPGEDYVMTMVLRSDLPRAMETARFDLDIVGPTGYYRFEMTVKGPLPAQGVSVIRITPQHLAAASEERYLISPTEIFGEPGVYSVRVLLYSPVFAPAK